MYKINPALSVKKGRVIREISIFEKVLNCICMGILIVLYPFIGISVLSKGIRSDTVTMEMLAWAFFGTVTGILILYSVLKINRLRRAGDFPAEGTMGLVKAAAENLGWKKAYHNTEFSGFTRQDWLSWDWGKELTIVYNGNELLINCVALGKGSSYSPFHWLPTIRAENKFITELRRLQAAADVSSPIQL